MIYSKGRFKERKKKQNENTTITQNKRYKSLYDKSKTRNITKYKTSRR